MAMHFVLLVLGVYVVNKVMHGCLKTCVQVNTSELIFACPTVVSVGVFWT